MQEIDFKFSLELAKAENRDGRMFVQGVASTTSVDLQNDAFSLNALKAMADGAIGIPLVTSHNHELGDEIGTIHSAELRGDKLFIEGELDNDDVMAQRLFKKIKKSGKAGFSVGASLYAKPQMNKSHRILDDVKLNHVMITTRPVNTETFCTAITKSLTNSPDLTIISDEDVLKDSQMENEAIEKAGAKFSDDTKAALKGIHDAGDDAVKSQVKDLLGSEVDETFWSTPEVNAAPESASEATSDTPAEDGSLGETFDSEPAQGQFVGVTKAEVDQAVSEALAPRLEELAKQKKDLEDAISAFKTETANLKVGKSVEAPKAKTNSIQDLRKALPSESDVMANLILEAIKNQ
jgi:hypothetical protein